MNDNDKQRRGKVASREELLQRSRRDPSRRESSQKRGHSDDEVKKMTPSSEAR